MIWTKKITSYLLSAIFLLLHFHAAAQTYAGKNIRVGIFSSTPLEDIKAATDQCSGVIIGKTKEIAIQVPIKTLEFDKKLMQEHFNENYMESDQYPYAKFKGVIAQQIDFGKDGDYTVVVNGTLSVHGVDQKRSIPGKISIKNGMIQINTEFKVACADHHIKIPKLVFTKIAEQITIKVDGKLNPIK
ncbi:YceI family protein [Pedobacter frigoris]|uniref:YceI family protein n=1 Tax=Pedobacter frigoris TaxID=2571272 RepID=UPI00292D0A66|nr:YceI family protein [Pedobacter frigoris]